MDSREYINKPASSREISQKEEAGMAALLKEALADTCPEPGGKIAAAVMAQIRRELEAEEKARRAEKASERRRRQGLFMKWGGMAACMMILCGVLVVAAPLMNRSEMAEAEQAVSAETVPELLTADAVTDSTSTEAYREEGTLTYTYTGVNETTEEAMVTKSAPVKQNSTAADTDDGVSAEAEEAPAEMSMVYAARPAASDAAYDPAVENQLYLTAILESGQLSEAVYNAWMAENNYDDITDWTIAELQTAFGFGE